ncbi:hypothetical protein HD553DRAFT_326329 [Filobasidium floriforme]|uniref:uncharacterized protein n=1 Tax=Filobasidium floriforme TaxID=5210 RepID=UPI001E8DDB68|nr:uncharacterized protein HD553DRAFT_326329 [Filobasidium floriforme]KAH8080018.1 hypothetical protein HD553DRAFT_326329 [Filobasidium floriforme]
MSTLEPEPVIKVTNLDNRSGIGNYDVSFAIQNAPVQAGNKVVELIRHPLLSDGSKIHVKISVYISPYIPYEALPPEWTDAEIYQRVAAYFDQFLGPDTTDASSWIGSSSIDSHQSPITMPDQEYPIEVTPGEPPVQNGYHLFDAVFHCSSASDGNVVLEPKESARARMSGHGVRVLYKIKAEGDRLPSNLTVKKIEVLIWEYVEEQYYGKPAPSEGGTTNDGSLATTNSTS